MIENKIFVQLNKWFNLLGIDPNKEFFSGHELNHYNFIKQCKLSVNYDPSLITTLIFLRQSIKCFLMEKNFNYLSIIENEDIFKSLNSYKEIYLSVNSKENNELIEEFKNDIKEKVNFYKNNQINNSFEELLNNELNLSEIKLKALSHLKNMQEFQFYKGLFSNSKDDLKFFPFLYQFDNIHSLIGSLCNTNSETLITISLIKDKITDNDSYFAFGIKNGQNIYVLTDKEKTSHPREKYMRRSRGRDFVNRVEMNMFPYEDVLNFDINYKNSAKFYNDNKEKLIELSNKPMKIKHLSEVNDLSFIWIIMMFDIIKENYFTNTKTLSEISYTGKMVFDKTAQKLNTKSLRIYEENSFELKPIENEKVSYEIMINDWDIKPTGINNWIENKFKNDINLEDLNLVDLNDNSTNLKTITLKTNTTMNVFNQDSQDVLLESFKMTEFGTEKELKKTQKWIARYNQALNIERLNQLHFFDNKERIINWYKNKINENLENILEYIARNELIVTEKYYPENSHFATIDKLLERRHNILNSYMAKDMDCYSLYPQFSISKLNDGKYLSQVEENKNPSLVFIFRPINAESLLKLCNVDFNDLPEELQNWTQLNVYTGNAILNNVDPMEWVVKNYWNKLKLSFSIYLTKKEYGDLRKKHGLENNKFWLKNI